MSAAEKIQAAIEKLEALRTESTPGRWSLQGLSDVGHGLKFETMRRADADLIVTLHRTIDAQLELLQSALKFIGETSGASSHSGPAFTLADAILGDPA